MKNINEILDKLASQFEMELVRRDKKDVKLIINKGLADNQCNIKVDGIRFNQILMNLIGNAIKFTEKGSIEFGYKLVEKYKLLFYVKDTGIGLSDIDQKIIFDRFRQADNPYKKNMGGTGLGLSISEGLFNTDGRKKSGCSQQWVLAQHSFLQSHSNKCQALTKTNSLTIS